MPIATLNAKGPPIVLQPRRWMASLWLASRTVGAGRGLNLVSSFSTCHTRAMLLESTVCGDHYWLLLFRLVLNLAKTHASFQNRRFLTVILREFSTIRPNFAVFFPNGAFFPG
jgi:hypothetical protein